MATTSVTGIAKLEAVAAFTMALVFGVVAGILGLVMWFSGYSGGSGLLLALALSLVLMFVQWWFSPALIRLIMRLEEVKPGEQEWLRSAVGKLAKDAGIPMPRLYIVQNPTPNAFAFGRTQKSAGIAVHTGLLGMLDKHEVEAVLAHEIGHIKHRDMIAMTVASVLPVLLYYIAIALGSRDRDRERGGSTVLVFMGAMFARMLGSLLVMWLSRTREYYADEFSARITKKPQNLMTALSRISYGLKAMPSDGGAVRAFYIADPQTTLTATVPQAMSLSEIEAAVERDKSHGFMEIFMTHPLTSKRLLNLKRLETESA